MARGNGRADNSDGGWLTGEPGGSSPAIGPGDGGFTVTGGDVEIDPASIGPGDAGVRADGEPRKRRGRQPGTKNKPKVSSGVSVGALEGLLFSTHQLLAAIAKTPELALDETEAKQLAEAATNVARHYNIEAGAKAIDWSNLMIAMGMIYGTRIAAVMNKKKGEAKGPPMQGNVVFPFGSSGVPGS